MGETIGPQRKLRLDAQALYVDRASGVAADANRPPAGQCEAHLDYMLRHLSGTLASRARTECTSAASMMHPAQVHCSMNEGILRDKSCAESIQASPSSSLKWKATNNLRSPSCPSRFFRSSPSPIAEPVAKETTLCNTRPLFKQATVRMVHRYQVLSL